MSATEFLKDVQAETARIHWPSRKKAITLTILVVVLSLLVAAYLGVLDFIFTGALEEFLIQ